MPARDGVASLDGVPTREDVPPTRGLLAIGGFAGVLEGVVAVRPDLKGVPAVPPAVAAAVVGALVPVLPA